jgi:hypothetical protein
LHSDLPYLSDDTLGRGGNSSGSGQTSKTERVALRVKEDERACVQASTQVSLDSANLVLALSGFSDRNGYGTIRAAVDRLDKVLVLLSKLAAKHNERQIALSEFIKRMGKVVVALDCLQLVL